MLFLKLRSKPLILAAFLAGLTAPTYAETLADALKLAYQTNPNIQSARASLRATDEGVAQAKSAQRPVVTGSAAVGSGRSISNNENSDLQLNLRVGVSQQFYDGGQTKLNIEAARYSVLAAREGLVDIEQQVLLEVVTQYMNVRRDIDIVKLSENNVKVLRQQVRAAKDRFDVGEVTRTDVSQTEAQLAAARSGLELNKANLAASRQAYRNIVGKLPGTLATPPRAPNLPKSVRAAEQLAVKNHPRIQQARFNQLAAETALESAKLNKSPTLTASGQLQRNAARGAAPQDSLNVQIQADKTFYQGGRLNSQRRQQLAAVDQAKANLQLQAANTKASVNRAYNNWRALRAAISAGREQVRAAQIAFNGVQEEAKLGARTTLDTLSAEQTLLDARTSLVSSIRDEYVAAYTVMAELGLLTTDKLGLNVERYNPDANYSAVNSNPRTEKRFKLLDKLQNR